MVMTQAQADTLVAQIEKDRLEREALRQQFTETEDFRLDAANVDAFLGLHPVKSKGYGMIIGSKVVTSEEHFRKLVEKRDEIDLELVFDHPDEASDVQEIRAWLLGYARRG